MPEPKRPAHRPPKYPGEAMTTMSFRLPERLKSKLHDISDGARADWLCNVIEHAYDIDRIAMAQGFMAEVLDSVETLSGIADEHGARTLADLMYLQQAIMTGGFIEHIPGESKVLDIVQGLPSGKAWAEFIEVYDPALEQTRNA